MAEIVTYGWDASHYDGTLTTSTLVEAKSQGIAFFSHKLGEGLGNVDTTAATALSAARSAGIRVVGGYWFIHGNVDAVAAANKCIAVADQHEPWWRDFPGWFWQTDAETSSTGLPSPAYIKKFSDTLASRTGKIVVVYASRGLYGNRLAGIGHRLWNADYGSNPHGQFKSIYPGNGSRGWTVYSGQTPTFLQYGSNATIAGHTTCDANAFRGTIDQLAAIIEGDDMPLSDSDIKKIVAAVWHTDNITDNYPWKTDASTNPGLMAISAVKDGANQAHDANVGVAALQPVLAAQAKQISALTAAVTAARGGAGGDPTEILNAIAAVGARESDEVTRLQAQIASIRGTLDATTSALQSATTALAATQSAVHAHPVAPQPQTASQPPAASQSPAASQPPAIVSQAGAPAQETTPPAT